MENNRKSSAALRIQNEKESIANAAKWILVAFCLQFVFYLLIINIIPYFVEKTDAETGEKYTAVNDFYVEKWNDSKNVNGNKTSYNVGEHTESNGMGFIYTYNMILLTVSIILMLYYLTVFMEEYKGVETYTIKEFFRKNKGLLILSLFMIWVFISSCLAYDTSRSFFGCYNLRDGYFSFMFYGSVLISIMLLGLTNFEGKIKNFFNKFEIDPRKLVVNTFLAVMTVIAGITLGDYYQLNYTSPDNKVNMNQGLSNKQDVVELENEYNLGISIEPKHTGLIKIGSQYRFTSAPTNTSVTSSVFYNSNHYAYVLSISIIAAAIMFIKEETNKKYFYALSYVIMVWMLIINNTFGAYLGITMSFILLFIHGVITKKNILNISAMLAIFIIASCIITNTNNENIVLNNFSGISNDIKTILGSKEKNEGVELSTSENDGNEKAVENQQAVGDTGSGRGKLWIGALKIIGKNPIFGVGLENMLYAYGKIGINEGRSHNLLLQLAGTTGIPGMLLYVLGIAFIFFKALKYYKVWDTYTYMGMFVMISYLISSLTGNSGFYTSGYFYIFVGFVVVGTMRLERLAKEEKNKKVLTSNNSKKAK